VGWFTIGLAVMFPAFCRSISSGNAYQHVGFSMSGPLFGPNPSSASARKWGGGPGRDRGPFHRHHARAGAGINRAPFVPLQQKEKDSASVQWRAIGKPMTRTAFVDGHTFRGGRARFHALRLGGPSSVIAGFTGGPSLFALPTNLVAPQCSSFGLQNGVFPATILGGLDAVLDPVSAVLLIGSPNKKSRRRLVFGPAEGRSPALRMLLVVLLIGPSHFCEEKRGRPQSIRKRV